MKKYFFILILGLIISGCSSSYHIKKAKNICPECFKQDTSITELVFKRDTIIKIDTNILVLLPRDTVFIDTTIRKLKPYSFKPIYAKNGIINVKVFMTRGVLKVTSHLDSAMIYRFQDSIRVKDAIISNLKEVTIEQSIVIKDKKTLIQRLKSNQKTLINTLIGVIILISVGIIIKFIKWIKK